MNLLVAVLALALQDPAARSPQVPSGVQARSDAYLDSGAADIVRRARARKAGEDRSLLAFRVMATQRVGVGMRALLRDRIIYHHEVAARIEWHRGGTTRVEALGARAGVPIVSGRSEVPGDLHDLFSDLTFEPGEDLLRFIGTKTDEGRADSPRHPIAEGSEAHYRYRSGDTTVLRFPDGRSITVVELVVIPRRAEFWLVSGSFWFDADTYGLVRAVFRTARPFDLELDADADDVDDASEIPGILKPIRAEIGYVTIEYGLQGFRWWLPRIVALEATGSAGSIIRMPIRFERLYTEYQVDGGEGLPPGRTIALPPGRADVPMAGRPRPRPRVRAEVRTRGDTTVTDYTVVEDSVSERRTVKRQDRGDTDARTIEIILPRDRAVLAESPMLPPAFFEPGGQMVSESDLRELGRAVGLMPGMPGLTRSALRWAPRDPTMFRYNRVEGLSFGVRYDAERGDLAIDAAARLGLADFTPNVELGLTRTTPGTRYRASAYTRLASVDPATRPLGVGNSLSAALFGRDDGDYFRAHGVELAGAPAPSRSRWYEWRLYAELQRTAQKETDVSLRRLWDGDHRFRQMVAAARADQVGASLGLRGQRGADPSRLVLGGNLFLEGVAGAYRFARASVATRATFPLPVGLRTSLEAAAGSALGQVPPQSLWYLGGPATLRGYPGAAAVGDAFWRARVDLGTSFAAARVTLFGDAGWAGSRRDFADNAPFTGEPLLSWGVGASFLDGLVRLDFARGLRRPAGWRVDLYWDGAL